MTQAVTNTETDDENRPLLTDSVRDYVARSCDAAARAESQAHPKACVERRWQDFAELGWLSLPVPMAHGGLAGSAADICAMCEQLGRGLVNEPFVASAVLPGALLASLPVGAPVAQLQSRLADGSMRLALACWESGHVFDTAHISTQATRDGASYRLQGDKTMVPGGAAAHALIVPALMDADRFGLFLVAADAAGTQLSGASL
jgi:alkylation response protein AidB-like acyl-CoA dehydrogenase